MLERSLALNWERMKPTRLAERRRGPERGGGVGRGAARTWWHLASARCRHSSALSSRVVAVPDVREEGTAWKELSMMVRWEGGRIHASDSI